MQALSGDHNYGHQRQLHDFCPDHSDNFVAMIEANPTFHDPSLCKIYEIGRGREMMRGGDGQDGPNLIDFDNSDSGDSESSSSSSEDHYSSSEEGDEENVANLI
uniref:Uncharacterized protein n=1 Tax=Ditylenchus dipsaci TaxID=166011 RepID=A0A915E3J2_9BILA